MSTPWINVTNVVRLMPLENIDDAALNKVVASLAGKSIVGTVVSCPKVINLLEYARRTDSQVAWNVLCILYRHTAFLEALKSLPADEADDVAQQVMLSVWNTRARLKADTNLGGWVRVIAKNAVADVIRSRKLSNPEINAELDSTEVEFVPEAEEVEAASNESVWEGDGRVDYDTPDAILEAEQTFFRLSLARNSLPKTTVAMLDMVADGMSYQEVALTVGLKEDAVRKSVARAKAFMLSVVNDMNN